MFMKVFFVLENSIGYWIDSIISDICVVSYCDVDKCKNVIEGFIG